MYSPALRLSATSVPILSKTQLEHIAERYVQEYHTALDPEGYRIDPTGFAEQNLKLRLQYEWLSNNGCYLGMAVFRDDTVIPVYVPEKNAAKPLRVAKNTILIDHSMQEEYKRYGEQFTILHECAHQILHWAYYRHQDAVPCRREAVQPTFDPQAWTDEDRMEWQANYLASALLLPLSALNSMIQQNDMLGYYEYRLGRGVSEYSAFNQAVMDVSFRFGVSNITAKIRLQGIGFGKGIREALSIS